MHQPYQTSFYSPNFVPPAPHEIEGQGLRRAAGFIGVLMLFLTATMQFTYPLIVLFLTWCGYLSPGSVTKEQLGLDNTTFLCIYACVYALAMGLPLLLALGYRRLFTNKWPCKPISGGVVFLAILFAVGGCMTANIVTSILISVLENFNVPVPDMPEMMEHTPISLLLNLLIIAVLPAVLEEAVFRGCVLRVLRPYGDGFALIVSAILFGLMHGNIRQIPFAVIVGLILGWLYVTTNAIWLPMLVHFINNALSVCMEYLAFDMTDESMSIFYGTIIYCLAILGGAVLLILLVVRGQQLRMHKHNTALRTSDKVTVLIKSPAFVISVIAFIGLSCLEWIV